LYGFILQGYGRYLKKSQISYCGHMAMEESLGEFHDDCQDSSEDETRKMVAKQNRKGKKSGGFQAMGKKQITFN